MNSVIAEAIRNPTSDLQLLKGLDGDCEHPQCSTLHRDSRTYSRELLELSLVVPIEAMGRIAPAQGHKMWQWIWCIYAYQVPEVIWKQQYYIIVNSYNYSSPIQCQERGREVPWLLVEQLGVHPTPNVRKPLSLAIHARAVLLSLDGLKIPAPS